MTITPTPGQLANLAALIDTPGDATVAGIPTGWEQVPTPDEADDRPWLARFTIVADDGRVAEFDVWPPLEEGEEAGDEPTDGQAATIATLLADPFTVGVAGTRTGYEFVEQEDDPTRPWRARWTITAEDGTTGQRDEWPDLSPVEQEQADADAAERAAADAVLARTLAPDLLNFAPTPTLGA